MRTLAICLGALAFAAPAAASPGFALFDLHDLAKASKNEYGDVKVTRGQPAAPFVVRCAGDCRFGAGWLGFVGTVGPRGGEVVSASSRAGPIGWSLRLRLTRRGRSAWLAYRHLADRRARRDGVADVLAVAVAGRILAVPLANQVRLAKSGVLDVPGFTRAGARAAAKTLAG